MELLSAGTDTTPSAEFTLTEATPIFISSGHVAPTATAIILRKTAAGNFTAVAKLTGRKPNGILPAGTYKVQRKAGNAAFSVEHG